MSSDSFWTQSLNMSVAEQRQEYLAHLCDTIAPVIVDYYEEMYETVKTSPEARTGILMVFQRGLSDMAHMASSEVDFVTRALVERSGCTYFRNLLKTLFALHTRFMLLDKPAPPKMHLKVPSSSVFLHRCLLSMARVLFKSPELMSHHVRSIERQANRATCERLARKCIAQVLRDSLPLDQILALIHESSSDSDGSSVSCEAEDKVEEEDEEDEEHDVEDTDTDTITDSEDGEAVDGTTGGTVEDGDNTEEMENEIVHATPTESVMENPPADVPPVTEIPAPEPLSEDGDASSTPEPEHPKEAEDTKEVTIDGNVSRANHRSSKIHVPRLRLPPKKKHDAFF